MRIMQLVGDAVGRAFSFLPNVLAALIILVVGLFVAKIVEKVARRLLMAVGRRGSVRRFFADEMSVDRVPHLGGRIVYWVLALVTLGLAVDSLHLPWLSAGVARVIGYLPSVLAAGVVVAIGYLAGNFLFRRMLGTRREASSLFWARIVRGVIFAVAAFTALQQLGIATTIITTAFAIVLSAMAVAGALAFGLGNRELAGRITREWYERRNTNPLFRRYDPAAGEGEEEGEGRRTDPHH
jgi:hypothetical protein